jgi:RNA polymerase sigma-B factor
MRNIRGPDAAALRYAETGDRRARDTVVSMCEPLVRGVARDYDNPGLSDDLVQVGYVGLLNAIEQFDPARGTPFVLFARPYIRGEISHYLRDHHTTVRRPRWLEQATGLIDRATDESLSERGRHPRLADLAATLNLDEKALIEILRTRETVRTLSLDTAEAGGQPLDDPCHAAPAWEVRVEDRTVLLAALSALNPLQRAVVFYIFFTDFTQMDTAHRLGISQKHVSRVLAAALLRLRQLLPDCTVSLNSG